MEKRLGTKYIFRVPVEKICPQFDQAAFRKRWSCASRSKHQLYFEREKNRSYYTS